MVETGMLSDHKKSISLKGIKTVLCTLIIIVAVGAVICPMKNNIALESFSRQLYSYALPPETELIEQHEVYGNLVGNEKQIDFLAVILLKSKLDEKEIKSYYFKAHFKGAKEGGNYPSVEIFKPKSSTVTSNYLSNKQIYFKQLEGIEDLSDYMVVVIRDGGYDNWFDIKSH